MQKDSPYEVARYQSEYIISVADFQILQQTSTLYALRKREYHFASKNGKITLDPQAFRISRKYRAWQGKYYLDHMETTVFFTTTFDDPNRAPFISQLNHEFSTTKILTGPKYKVSQPNYTTGFYPLWDFDQVPFDKQFWDDYDEKN